MSENAGQNRLLSLDVFRGMTIAGMVLVNNPGTWSAIYPPLQHAEWHGTTPTDLVFPFFLFIVGISITLALGKRVEVGGINKDIYLKIFRRSLIIFALGLFLAIFPFYNFTKGEWVDFSTLRIMGVLQRIAVCYLVASLIFVRTNWKQQAFIAGSLLLAHPAMKDPNFRRSVVLMSVHNDEGAMGVVLNRPMGKRLGELSGDFALGPLSGVPLFNGGPDRKSVV